MGLLLTQLATELGATVIAEPRRGFGAACHTGLVAAEAEVVCFMDCDGSLDPADLPRVCGPVIDDSTDLVMGARIPERGAWPLHARLANRWLASEMRRRSNLPLTDLGPMRAARGAEELFDHIEGREQPPVAVGVLETRKLPGDDVVAHICEAVKVPAAKLTLLAAPAASMAGSNCTTNGASR